MVLTRDSRTYRLWLACFGILAGWILRLLGKTWRIEHRNSDPIGTSGLGIGCMWHQGFLPAAYIWRDRGVAVVVSNSRDGDLIDAALQNLGFGKSLRGSSSRRGAHALLAAVRSLREGQSIAVLLDGPRGPAKVAKEGAVSLARKTGIPVISAAFTARPKVTFRSWDRTILPLPFAKVICDYGPPLKVPTDCSDSELDAIRKQLERSVETLTCDLEESLK